MNVQEVSAILWATSAQIKDRIHLPQGGYSDSNQLGDAVELEKAARLILLYPSDLIKAWCSNCHKARGPAHDESWCEK